MSRRPRRHMSADDRDLQGLEARAARERARPEARDAEDDAVVRRPDDDFDAVTSPIALLSRELTETQSELARDLGVDLDAPVSFGQFVKLIERVNDVKREERRKHRENSNRLMEAMGKRPPAEELKAMRIKVNVLWGLLLLALIAAGSSLVKVTQWLKESGREEVQRQQLIDQSVDHERRLRRLEWRGLDSPSRGGVGSSPGQ